MDGLILLMAGVGTYSLYSLVCQRQRIELATQSLGVAAHLVDVVGHVIRKVLGGLILGGGGYLFLVWQGGRPADFGFVLPTDSWWLLWVSGGAAVVLPVVIKSASGEEMQRNYPELRNRPWTPGVKWLTAFSWAVFLLGYELFFRGFMTYGLVAEWGAPLGLTVTVIFYAVVHWPKGMRETIGCIPMGIFFGCQALYGGGFLGPWLLHLAIAVVGENAAVRAAAQKMEQ